MAEEYFDVSGHSGWGKLTIVLNEFEFCTLHERFLFLKTDLSCMHVELPGSTLFCSLLKYKTVICSIPQTKSIGSPGNIKMKILSPLRIWELQ